MSWIIHTHLHATFSVLVLLFLHLTPPIEAQQPPAWSESNQNYNSPMATALIVMIIVFFSVGFISVYLRHFLACFGYRPYGGTLGLGGGGQGGWMREPTRGLDPNIVNTFPTFLYSDVKVHRVGKPTPLECAICLNEFADHEVLRLLPKCNHVFHPHCIGPWLASHVTCPVCRANLEIQVCNQKPRHELISELEPDPGPEPSSQIVRQDDHPRDVIVRVGLASPETQEMIKGLSESGRIRLQRSHSTGHSLVENSDRFTLRLPEEVRNKLVNFNNLSGLPAAIVSPRVGYRARSLSGATTSSGKPDRWSFSMSPPFVTRPGSPKLDGSIIGTSKNNVSTGILRSPISLFKSLKSPNKSPLNHGGSKSNDIGERSSDRLWANRGRQEDLEYQ